MHAPLASAPICLVSMPFMPGTLPSLGISLLKSSLNDTGIGCDILYGSMHLIDAMAQRADIETALLDYQLVGSTGHLGDLMFAPAYWEDPALYAAVRDGLEEAAMSLPSGERAAFVARQSEAPVVEALERCFAARDWRRFRIVGFSSTFAQSLASLWLARRIKRASPETVIVFGGANVDGTMGPALLDIFPFVDHVLQGEADHSLPLYVQAILDGAPLDDIPGLIRRTPAGARRAAPAVPITDLDALAIPDFTDFFEQLPGAWSHDNVMLPFETSRGCWWGERSHCVFCGLNADAMRYRAKGTARALAEVDTLRERWGIRRLWAVDNILPREYFDSYLPALARRDLNLFYETKANLHDWQVAGLAAAGVTQIQPGVESLNTALLKLMKKGVNRVRNIQLLRSCQAHSVDPLWFYLYGLPGDEAEQYLEDAALMPRLVHLPPPRSINPITVDRFSPLYATARLGQGPALTQQREHRLAFAGLDEAQSASICYHFDARVGSAEIEAYRPALVRALAHWRARYDAGAQLAALAGAACTLIFDDRSGDGARLFLLTGMLHGVHAAIDRGASRALIEERCAAGTAEPDPDDLAIIIAATRHGAEFAPEVESVVAALDWLDARGLVARDGAVWQALAVPGLTMLTALRLGLEAQALRGVALSPLEPSAAPTC